MEKLAWPRAPTLSETTPWFPSPPSLLGALLGWQNLTDGDGGACPSCLFPASLRKDGAAFWKELWPSPQLTLESPPERMSAACCRGWEPYCTRPGSRRTQLPSDSISPRPEEWKADLIWGEERTPQDSCLPSSLTGMRHPPSAGDCSICGSSRPTSSLGVQPLCVSRLPGSWELRGSFSASRGTRLA